MEEAEINIHYKNIWLQIPVVKITKLLSSKLKNDALNVSGIWSGFPPNVGNFDRLFKIMAHA
jgi:hypothetical protein